MWPSYRKLLGKYNTLLKRKCISNFYSVNGKLKIKRRPADDHAIFGDEIINGINRGYEISKEESQSVEQSAEQ